MGWRGSARVLTAGIIIFLVTYALVSARRIGWFGLDRPAATLIGAVACVFFGVLTPHAALHSVDYDTLLLLLGVMGMGAFLVLDGFVDVLEGWLSRWMSRPAILLGAIIWGSGILSGFITNDAVCILGAPLVVRLIQRGNLPALPFLLALATGANTGSVATLVGNPQNMLCGILGQLDYLNYALKMAPVAVVGLAINHAVLRWVFRKSLISRTDPMGQAELNSATFSRQHLLTLGIIALSAIILMTGAPLAWTAVGGFSALLILHKREAREIWGHIDWSLLLFFAGLFVVVEGLRASGATEWFFEAWPLAALASGSQPLWSLGALFLFGSNLVSNVPFILMIRDQMATLPNPQLGWELLAMASTFAGNLTLLGSAANVIVAEGSREVGGFGFFEHLKVGAIIAILTTAFGVMWLTLIYTYFPTP